MEHALCILSADLDHRLSDCENKYVENDGDDTIRNGRHDLALFVTNNITTHSNTIDFFLKCWRVLLYNIHESEYEMLDRELTFDFLWETMVTIVVASNFPVFTPAFATNGKVTYNDAYAVLKRACEILEMLSKRTIRDQKRPGIELPQHLRFLRLEIPAHPKRPMHATEWVYLLRSWFRWNKVRYPASPLLRPEIGDDDFADVVQSCLVVDIAPATCVAIEPENPQPFEVVKSQKPIVDELLLHQLLQKNIDDFGMSSLRSVCCCFDESKMLIYSKHGRLNPLQQQFPDTLARIQILTQYLQQSSSRKEMHEKDRFCLALRVNANRKLLGIDLLSWTDMSHTHQTHCLTKI